MRWGPEDQAAVSDTTGVDNGATWSLRTPRGGIGFGHEAHGRRAD